jgi:ubiquinone/menaquinone biosynthesis C-methylase UbiE
VTILADAHAAFVGSIPENYDRYLGPMFFEPYAADLMTRIPALTAGRVLELACGTGIVTRKLRDTLPSDVELVATDLNPAMLDHARKKFRAGEKVELLQADACALPFGDGWYACAVCQFGFMFFPDKQQAFCECARVLSPGGVIAFNVWESLEFNDFARTSNDLITARFPNDPPTFYKTPFGFHDRTVIGEMLSHAGFETPVFSTVDRLAISPSALDAATGLIEGNPIRAEIEQRNPLDVPVVAQALRDELARNYGDGPTQGKLRATVCVARLATAKEAR